MMEALRALRRRVESQILRMVLTGIDDAQAMQILQLAGRSGEVKDGVERFQNYGVTSWPRAHDPDTGRGAEAIAVAIEQNLRAVLSVDDRRYRPRGEALRAGDVAIYTDLDEPLGSFHDDQSPAPRHRVQLTRDDAGERLIIVTVFDGTAAKSTFIVSKGSIVAIVTDGADTTTATFLPAKIKLDTKLVEITGRLIDNTAAGNAHHVDEMRAIFDGHVHPENDSGGPTSPPTTEQGPG